jgi:hypothetical protein
MYYNMSILVKTFYKCFSRDQRRPVAQQGLR